MIVNWQGIIPAFFIEVKMTVSTTTNKTTYIGNGVATTFAIPFPFLEKEHLKVRQLLNNVQTERTDWTISGGNMIFEAAPAENARIVIMREVPLTQETDYRENEILPAETLERNFDKLTMQIQQLKEQADRAVTVDIFDNTDASSLIPSIRQAVSDCAGYASTATNKVQMAITQAGYAEASAQAAALSEQNAANLLANKADKNVYATTSQHGLAQWSALTEEISENKPSVIISVVKNGNTIIRSWSDGLKEVFDSFNINGNGALSYTFPTVFNSTPFIMLSQTHESGGAVTSVVSSSSTGITFTVRSGGYYFGFLGWIYLCGY